MCNNASATIQINMESKTPNHELHFSDSTRQKKYGGALVDDALESRARRIHCAHQKIELAPQRKPKIGCDYRNIEVYAGQKRTTLATVRLEGKQNVVGNLQ